MRKVRTLLFAIVAVVGISVFGINAQSVGSNSLQSSAAIAQKAYSKLRGLPRYGVFDNITVAVRGNTVILEGKVVTLGTKSAAERTMRDIPGVSEVVNNIEELPIGSFDNQIRREAYRSFVTRGPGQYFSELNPDVRIIVENGRITLEGYVSRRADSDLLNILANGVSGTFSVTNNLIVGKRIA